MFESLWNWLYSNFDLWEAFGLAFQGVFTSRFLVQWIASERQKRSVIPIAFWYLSLVGSAGLLIYAVGIGSIAIVLGQAFGSVVYIRNLMLVYRGGAETTNGRTAPPS